MKKENPDPNRSVPGFLRIPYNIFGMLLMPFVSIYYIIYSILKKRKIYQAFQRIGIYSHKHKHKTQGPFVHIHCVSLGEAMIGHKLSQSLKSRYNLLFTTITDSGFKYLLKQEGLNVCALPLDCFPFVRSFFKNFDIKYSIFIETEIWPEFITQARRNGIKMYLANARLSKRSFPKYKRLKYFFRPLLEAFSKILVQSDDELSRFRELGISEHRLINAGNLKYDLFDFEGQDERIGQYIKEFNINRDDIILIAGSTFDREEEILCSVMKRLRDHFNNIRLIIAPRHPHRFEQVYNYFRKEGFFTVKRDPYNNKDSSWKVFILNTIGELKYFYGICSIAFVGGSLVKIGGHNILEPAYWSKPVIMGRHYFNFTIIVNDFISQSAVLIAEDEDMLYEAVKKLAEDKEYRAQLGINAKKVLESRRGALYKTQKAISDDFGNAP